MLRQTVIFAVFAVLSAGIALAIQQDPQALRQALSGFAGSEPPAPPALVARAEPRSPGLSGRRASIPADARGHFQAQFRLNGRAIEALVDTGATLVAINRSTARRIGLTLAPADFRYEVSTANGKARAAAATIDRLQLGRIDVTDVEVAVLEDHALDGVLIGMSFLNRLRGFRVENGALLLEQ